MVKDEANEEDQNEDILDKGDEDTGGDAPDEEQDFPAETKIADMTPAEQAAYWKHQSRKHEAEAKAHADYDELKAKLEADRKKSMTDTERALEDAKAQARAEAIAEYTKKAKDSLKSTARGILESRASKSKAIDFLDFDKFITDDGEIDLEAISDFAGILEGSDDTGGTDKFPKRDHNMGPRSHTRSGGIQAGREMAAKRFHMESKD